MEATTVVRDYFWKIQHATLEFVDVTKDLEISGERLHPLGQAVLSLGRTYNIFY